METSLWPSICNCTIRTIRRSRSTLLCKGGVQPHDDDTSLNLSHRRRSAALNLETIIPRCRGVTTMIAFNNNPWLIVQRISATPANAMQIPLPNSTLNRNDPDQLRCSRSQQHASQSNIHPRPLLRLRLGKLIQHPQHTRTLSRHLLTLISITLQHLLVLARRVRIVV